MLAGATKDRSIGTSEGSGFLTPLITDSEGSMTTIESTREMLKAHVFDIGSG